MKTKVLSISFLLMLRTFTLLAGNKMERIEVKGSNCNECKTHIEKVALDVEGVSMTHWNSETKELQVIFDDTKTSVEKIEKAIAKGGNDTSNFKASDEDFNKLPDCCKYERDEK